MLLRQALKEWAVLCADLAAGEHVVLLRKGGISEPGAGFELKHTRFWLFPTFLHQKAESLKPELRLLLESVKSQEPPAGTIRLCTYAQVVASYELHDIESATRIHSFHGLTSEAVQARFSYRQPGLLALVIRAFSYPAEHVIRDRPVFAGCKSWVSLEEELSFEGGKVVLSDDCFAEKCARIDELLKPVAMA